MSEFIIVIVLYSYFVLRPFLKKIKISANKDETKTTKVLLAFENIAVHMTAFFY
jgi:hypothetical protein